MPRGKRPLPDGTVRQYGNVIYMKKGKEWIKVENKDLTKSQLASKVIVEPKAKPTTTVTIKKEAITKKPKAPKLSKAEKKAMFLIEKKLGKSQNSIAIISQSERYYLVQRIPVKDKKDKFQSFYSHTDLEFIKEIGSKISEIQSIPYSSEPIVKEKRRKASKTNGFEVDRTIFREYRDQCFLQLDFGTIWLQGNNKFHTKRNYEKIDGVESYKLLAANKYSISYLRCKDLLASCDDNIKNQILKEVIHFGSLEDKNSVRVAMGMQPVSFAITDEGQVISMN